MTHVKMSVVLGPALVALGLAGAFAADLRSLNDSEAALVEDVSNARQAVAAKQKTATAREKIVGGEPADETPWAVAIAFTKPDGSFFQYCGGTLIGKRWVLTAAHCKVKPNHIAIVGRRILSSNAGKKIPIAAVRPHDDYNPNTSANDIALVQLSEDAPTNGIPMVDAGGDPQAGTKVQVLAWGLLREDGLQSDVLMQVKVPMVSAATCKAQYERADIDITSGMICAGEGGKDSCQGDSGGPLVLSDGSKVAGVVSFGIGCARPDFAGVYTSVASFRQWIKERSGI